jgi:hypothetical protein
MPSEDSLQPIEEILEMFNGYTDEQQQTALNYELREWRKVGLDTNRVMFDQFQMDVMLGTVVKTLIEELGIDENEMNRRYRSIYYERLILRRREFVKAKVHKPNIIVPGQN